MSDTPTEQPTDLGGSLGYTTRTDPIVGTGSQADVGSTETATTPPIAVDTGGTLDPSTQNDSQGVAGHAPGDPLGADAPKLETLTDQMCPNCGTGVLNVVRYDPYATHEKNQGAALLAGHESGGGYEVQCAYCDYSDSRAFNPGKLWGR